MYRVKVEYKMKRTTGKYNGRAIDSVGVLMGRIGNVISSSHEINYQ